VGGFKQQATINHLFGLGCNKVRRLDVISPSKDFDIESWLISA